MLSGVRKYCCGWKRYVCRQVKALADGRTYTAKQAKANGLIDEIATYQAVMNQMASELGVDEFYTPSSEESILAAIFSKAEKLVPKSEAQILKETAEEKESGVLMYYAEQFTVMRIMPGSGCV